MCYRPPNPADVISHVDQRHRKFFRGNGLPRRANSASLSVTTITLGPMAGTSAN